MKIALTAVTLVATSLYLATAASLEVIQGMLP